MQNWLITGGCGFIGRNLISHLLNTPSEIKIRILDNLSVGSKEELAEITQFEIMKSGDPHPESGLPQLLVGDITDKQDCRAALKGVDVVVHLAAQTGVDPSVKDPMKDLEVNVRGTLNLLESMRKSGVGTLVFASSGAPLGEVDPPIHEQKVARPVSPYGASKLAGEAYCSVYSKTFGISTVVLRFGNVYGPRSSKKNSVVAKFFKEAFAGKPLTIYGDGTQTRDFIYIKDLVNAVCLAADSDVSGEIFQIATHKGTTVNEIAESIRSIMVSHTGINDLEIHHAPVRAGDVLHNYSDISKAREMLGYEPGYSLADGLLETFHYFYESQNAE